MQSPETLREKRGKGTTIFSYTQEFWQISSKKGFSFEYVVCNYRNLVLFIWFCCTKSIYTLVYIV